ncbi:hypothetical protein KEM54_000783, partial [Ascosphaera aggregata]
DFKQTRFAVDAEPSDTIKSLKQKITQVRTEWDPESLKLIYSGKILQDDKTVESYNIEEKGYIVCMVQKPKQSSQSSTPAKTPSTPASAPKSSTAAAPAAQAPQRNAPTASTASTVSLGAEPATPSPAARATTQQPAATAPAAAPAAAAASTAAPAAATGAAAAAPAAGSTGGPLDDNSLLVGAASQNAIAEMEAMGFPRDMATRAMRAAFFNPDRAIEYLLNGIPESAEDQQQQPPPSQQSQQPPHAPPVAGASSASQSTVPAQAGATAGTTSDASTAQQPSGDEPINLFEAAASAAAQPRAPSRAGPGGGTTAASATASEGGSGGGLSGLPTIPSAAGQSSGGNLSFLRDSPHFQHLRSIVQQQPQMLEPILQSLGQGNPQLAQMIAAHQEEFLQLLSEEGGEGMEGLEGYDGVLPNAGQTTIAVTEEERDAIERLCNLGFSRDAVIQAYFACDKNEELAANFLFDQPDEDEP